MSNLYQSHLSRSSHKNEFQFVTMKLDDAEYTFDIRSGQWKMNILDKEYNHLVSQNRKNDRNNDVKSVEQLNYEAKLEQLETIKQQIKDLKQKMIDVTDQTKLSQECTQILTDTYVKEKLETERIKKAREKLDKVRQEMGY